MRNILSSIKIYYIDHAVEDKRKYNVGARECVREYYCCCRRIAQQLPDGEINNNWDVPDNTVTVYNPIADFYPFSPLSSAVQKEKYHITCVLRDLRFSGIYRE